MNKKLNMKPYQGEEDYWQMRQFLRKVMLCNNQREISWHVARLDYWWWFGNPELEKIDPEVQVFIWRTEAGKMAAILNPEERGCAYLQIHPEHRSAELLEEMVSTAEEKLMVTKNNGDRVLIVTSNSQDDLLLEILVRRGFQKVAKAGEQGIQHRCHLDQEIAEPELAADYIIRPLGEGLDLLERCYASGLGFHDDDIKTARENREDPTWYKKIQSAPLYRRDLDLLAAAPDGSIAAFSTFWFDDVTRTGYTEPVATVPAHRRKGLSKALLLTGLQRLKMMGCQVVFVDGYSEAANKLYFSVYGPLHDISEEWKKVVLAE